ncbi:hypothetical protein HDE_04421 [Halotydeus destructor]|nr:hypothetical protein HDE_04421 [Halotydeus destructor]
MSKLTLVALLAIFSVAYAQGPGPFHHQVLNDIFRAWLTTAKIIIDVFRRNLQNEEMLKNALRQALAPVVAFLREQLLEGAGLKQTNF